MNNKKNNIILTHTLKEQKKQLESLQNQIEKTMKKFYRIGKKVGFKRGKGVHVGEVYSVGMGKFCFEINIKLYSTGKHHWYRHSELQYSW